MTLPAVMQYIISGLTTGSVYAMIAVGFTLVYNTCDLINFAQGEFAMLGGMLAAAAIGGWHLPPGPAAALAVLATAFIGGAAALCTIYPLRRASPLGLIILTIGLSIIIRGGAMLAWGKDARIMPNFSQGAPITILGANLGRQAIWVLGIALCMAAGLILFFKRTNLGRAMRACAVNRRGAMICGINPRPLVVAAFALSAALGAVGGIVIAPLTMTSYDVGIMLGLKGFCAAIVGGLSSMGGAVAGGLVLGILEALGGGLVSSHLKEILAFLALLGILYLRPAGLFGRQGA
ncbi:MAG: branched-chain amino acid ABC transporter permease [Patescibacteria group bacterium]